MTLAPIRVVRADRCIGATTVLAAILLSLVVPSEGKEGTNLLSLPEDHTRWSATIRVDSDMTLMPLEAAEYLGTVAREASARVNKLLGVDPEAVGEVVVRVVRGPLFFEGDIGGSAGGIHIYTGNDLTTSDITRPSARFLLALEYTRVVLERTCKAVRRSSVNGLYSGIVVAVADTVYPGFGDFPVRDPHRVSAGLLVLNKLHIPTTSDFWMYSFTVGGSFCKYLIERFGPRKILELYSELRAGTGIDKALMNVYGEPLDVVEGTWRSFLRSIAEQDPERLAGLADLMLRLDRLWVTRAKALYLAAQMELALPERIQVLAQLVDVALVETYEAPVATPSITRAQQLVSQYSLAVQSWHEALEELWLRVALPFRADSTNYEDMLDAAEHVRELGMGLGAGDLVEKAEEYMELLRQKRATN